MKNIEIKIDKDEFKKKLDIKDGVDGITPSDDDILSLIKPLIPMPKEGNPGKDAVVDYEKIKVEILRRIKFKVKFV